MHISIPEPWRSILVAVLTALLTVIGGGTAVHFGCVRVPPQDERPGDKEKPPRPDDDKPAANPCDAVAKIIMTGVHCGYGVHIPGNREDGYVVARENADLQVRYRLSVSQGDSGGGIIATATGELLSPVCCTTRLNGVGDVWGASPRVIRSMLTHPAHYSDDLKPIAMPVRDLGETKSDGG
jgi:hypothetical protein